MAAAYRNPGYFRLSRLRLARCRCSSRPRFTLTCKDQAVEQSHLQRRTVRFLVFSASLRADSLNTRPADLAAACLEANGGSLDRQSHEGEVVRLYLEEGFSFHVATPEAAVALKP
jgi:hypothetical protein